MWIVAWIYNGITKTDIFHDRLEAEVRMMTLRDNNIQASLHYSEIRQVMH